MRDYKNVKVPGKSRPTASRANVKRVAVEGTRSARRTFGFPRKPLKLLALIALAAGIWLGWRTLEFGLHAEVFQISGVDVQGVRRLSETDLKKIAGPFTGQNIFRVDLDAAVRSVRANPWVKEVRIYRSLPNRISMTVVERDPFVLLESSGGRYVLDDEATAIERISGGNALLWRLPVVEIKAERAVPGEQVTSEGMAEALALLSEIAARGGWRLDGITIKANSPETLSVLYESCEFKIGSGNYAKKLRRLSEVMEDARRRNLNIAYVDVRAERQAAVMVKNDRVKAPAARVRKKS